MYDKVDGFDLLTEEQKEVLIRVNTLHINSLETHSEQYIPMKVWVDHNIVCSRLLNGQWFHYKSDGTWY